MITVETRHLGRVDELFFGKTEFKTPPLSSCKTSTGGVHGRICQARGPRSRAGRTGPSGLSIVVCIDATGVAEGEDGPRAEAEGGIWLSDSE